MSPRREEFLLCMVGPLCMAPNLSILREDIVPRGNTTWRCQGELAGGMGHWPVLSVKALHLPPFRESAAGNGLLPASPQMPPHRKTSQGGSF